MMSGRALQDLAEGLREALDSPSPVGALAAFLREVLGSDPVSWDGEDAHVARQIAERLDAASEFPDRFTELAADTEILVVHAQTAGEVALLYEIVAQRRRVVDVLGKYLDGPITRTGLLSFITEQRWPRQVRMRMSQFDDAQVHAVRDALVALDVNVLRSIILGQ